MEAVICLRDAGPWLRAYAGQTFVVKVSGDLADRPRWMNGVAQDVALLHRLGIRVVLVHGGGPQLDRLADQMNLPTHRVAGRRVTSPEVLEAAKREWRGRLSLAWVSALTRHGERAVGVSGLDGGLISARRRPPALITNDQGERVRVDFGCVGDVQSVRPDVLEAILTLPAIPVVSPLALGADAEALNVNADTVAAELAVALGAARLLLLTQTPGILTDPSNPDSALCTTDLATLDGLQAQGVLQGGMRPKVAAIRTALVGGVAKAHVIDGREDGALIEELFTPSGCGTLVTAIGAVSAAGAAAR